MLFCMKLAHLSGRKRCEYVKSRGRLWKGKHFSVRWISGSPRSLHAAPSVPALYVGSVASTKLDKSAVKRNRMRRRCREALRISLENTPNLPPAQLLLLPRSSSLSCTFSQLQTEAQTFLSTL